MNRITLIWMARYFCRAVFLLLTLFASLQTQSQSQSLPDSTKRKIDSLFSQWNSVNSPGCTIGIVQGDSLIYTKSYGMANLENAIPISPETVFDMGSVSKQFTAWSILLLAKQGKLKLDDDIRMYLPWFPDLKSKITIRHLLNHTSGIRDEVQLLAIAGTRVDDVVTPDHVFKVLGKQNALNFKPGEQFLYSNSNYTMLGEIAKTVSGKSLRTFADSAIFKPLGMNNTRFLDNITEIVKGRAGSYDRVGRSTFATSILSYSAVGATGVFTTMSDMSKWVKNMYQNKITDKLIFDSLIRKGKLNNGSEIVYAGGIGVLDYKGWKMLSHNGAHAGYTSQVTVFPDLKTGIIFFSNTSDINPEKVMTMQDLLIKNSPAYKAPLPPAPADTNLAIVGDTAAYRKFMGDYASDDGRQFYFFMRNDKITWVPVNGPRQMLIKSEKDTFYARNDPSVKFVFKMDGATATVDEYWPGNHRALQKYNIKAPVPVDEIKQYVGEYFSPELNATYNIIEKDQHLVFTHSKYPDAPMYLAGPDRMFSPPYWWMKYCQVIRNDKKEIIGFEVNTDRVLHLRFNKKITN